MTQDFADFKAPGNKPILNSIFDVSDNFLGELRLWLEQNPPAIGISNILGFSQFTAQSEHVATGDRETTSSTNWTDLTTNGPQVAGLPDGKYVVLFGCDLFNTSSGSNVLMGVKANTTEADSDNAILTGATSIASGSAAVLVTLNNAGNNTVKARYMVTGGTGSFNRRWLIALRYSNL